jgi:sRNA-binding carbon storage regulator CsrA
MKDVKIGDELIFDMSSVAEGASKEVSVTIVGRTGNKVRLRIAAEKSIPIRHFTQQRVPA